MKIEDSKRIEQNFPQELLACKNWVTWRQSITDTGRITKPPLNPNQYKGANTNDPATWGTYAEARNKAFTLKEKSGVGIVFDGTFFGLDFDDCIDSKTGLPYSWVQKIVDQLGSYTEYSPSGNGIHIICKGTLPDWFGVSCKRDYIEIYARMRFFTVTGRPLGEAKPLKDCTDAIIPILKIIRDADKKAKLEKSSNQKKPTAPKAKTIPAKTSSEIPALTADDQAIISKLKCYKNGELFTSLWNGQWFGEQAHKEYGSASEADLALCGFLARGTENNPITMDRIFRNSGLMRDKWDKDRSSSTYGERTILYAIKNNPFGGILND